MTPDPLQDPLAHLPHRDPFRFLSRLLSLAPGDRGEAVWSVSGREPFFQGHFPGAPIVPGVLISEALAQLSGIVAFHGSGPRPGRLAHIDIRIDSAVRPPAEVLLKSAQTRALGSLRQFEVSASVNNVIAARGTLTLAAADQQ